MFRELRGARPSFRHPAITGTSRPSAGASPEANPGAPFAHPFKVSNSQFSDYINNVHISIYTVHRIDGVSHTLSTVSNSQFSDYINNVHIYIYTVHKIAGNIDRVTSFGHVSAPDR